MQHIMGGQGIYTQTNVEKRRPYTVAQWYALCQQDNHRPPEIGTDRTSVTPTARKRHKGRFPACDTVSHCKSL